MTALFCGSRSGCGRFRGSRLRCLDAGEHRIAAAAALNQDSKPDRREHENNRGPGGHLGQQICRAAGTEGGLRPLPAKSTGQVSTLTLLQEDDSNQDETNNYVESPKYPNHASFNLNLWCGRGDLNPHASRRHPLKMVCLPISPLPQCKKLLDECYRALPRTAISAVRY